MATANYQRVRLNISLKTEKTSTIEEPISLKTTTRKNNYHLIQIIRSVPLKNSNSLTSKEFMSAAARAGRKKAGRLPAARLGKEGHPAF